MIQDIEDCEKKMLDMQKAQEKIESEGTVILDKLKALSVGHSV
jgi:hypothetical protein